MNKLLVLGVIIIILAVTLVLAQESATRTMTGYIIGNMSGGGYSLFSGGNLHRFTKESDRAVESYLEKYGSSMKVVAEVMSVGERLSLLSIRNQ